MDFDAMAFEQFVGDVVALVDDDFARRDAKRVRAVVPLLSIARYDIVAAARNQGDWHM